MQHQELAAFLSNWVYSNEHLNGEGRVLETYNDNYFPGMKMCLVQTISAGNVLVVRGSNNMSNALFDAMLLYSFFDSSTHIQVRRLVHDLHSVVKKWQEQHGAISIFTGHSLGGWVASNLQATFPSTFGYIFNAPFTASRASLMNFVGSSTISGCKDILSLRMMGPPSNCYAVKISSDSLHELHSMTNMMQSVQAGQVSKIENVMWKLADAQFALGEIWKGYSAIKNFIQGDDKTRISIISSLILPQPYALIGSVIIEIGALVLDSRLFGFVHTKKKVLFGRAVVVQEKFFPKAIYNSKRRVMITDQASKVVLKAHASKFKRARVRAKRKFAINLLQSGFLSIFALRCRYKSSRHELFGLNGGKMIAEPAHKICSKEKHGENLYQTRSSNMLTLAILRAAGVVKQITISPTNAILNIRSINDLWRHSYKVSIGSLNVDDNENVTYSLDANQTFSDRKAETLCRLACWWSEVGRNEPNLLSNLLVEVDDIQIHDIENDAQPIVRPDRQRNTKGPRQKEPFDEAFYCTLYPGVARAIAERKFPNGETHYRRHGKEEGRMSHFPESRYLAIHDDVRAAVERGGGTGRDHWLNFGVRENRRLTWFDPELYLELYPELAENFRDNPKRHWNNCGKYEDRVGWIDAQWYRAKYPDVDAAIKAGTMPSVRHHYVHHGRHEGRIPMFPEVSYLQANKDVRQAVKRGDFASGRDHWLLYGKAENRQFA